MLSAREAWLLSRCGNEIEKLCKQTDEHIRTAAKQGKFSVIVGYSNLEYDVNHIANELYKILKEKGFGVSFDVRCENEYETLVQGSSFFAHKYLIDKRYTARFEISWI